MLKQEKIPHQRLLVYLLIAAWLPALFVSYHFYLKRQTLKDMNSRLDRCLLQMTSGAQKQNANLVFLQRFKNIDPHYFDQHLESLSFLSKEQSLLEQLLSEETLLEPEPLQHRLQFLSGKENRLAFKEIGMDTFSRFKETQEALLHPVEVDGEDVIQILALMEGPILADQLIPPGRPHLLITEFKLERKVLRQHQEIFSLSMKCLKRDYQ